MPTGQGVRLWRPRSSEDCEDWLARISSATQMGAVIWNPLSTLSFEDRDGEANGFDIALCVRVGNTRVFGGLTEMPLRARSIGVGY